MSHAVEDKPARLPRLRPEPTDCRYGAPMGRCRRLPVDLDEPVKLRMVKLRFVDGDYDEGGAYWGCGNPIYFAQGTASDSVVELYARAATREEAKRKIRETLPNATFYR